MPTVGESSRRAALSGWPLGGSPHFSAAPAPSAFGAEAAAGADAPACWPLACVAALAADAGDAAPLGACAPRDGMITIPGDVPLMTPRRLSYSEPPESAHAGACVANDALAASIRKAVFIIEYR